MKTPSQDVSFSVSALARSSGEITPEDERHSRGDFSGLPANPVLTVPTEAALNRSYKLNSDKSVAVSTSSVMSKNMQDCPRGVKVLLLGAGGVLVIGHYAGESFWHQWHSLPKRQD